MRDGAEGRGGLRGEEELRREAGRRGRQRLGLAGGDAATLAAAAKLTGRGELPGREGGADRAGAAWPGAAGRRGQGRLEAQLLRCPDAVRELGDERAVGCVRSFRGPGLDCGVAF